MINRVSIGDQQLNVVDCGHGQPLLLVHGFPLDHTMWSGQIEQLADHCRVIAPDLPGFGQSDPVSGTLTMVQLADDLAALLDALSISEPITFCGLSMGGYIAWEFWRRHAMRLERLILCDTRAVADTEAAARGREEMANRVLEEGAEVIADAMSPKLFALSTREQRGDIVQATRQVMLNTRAETVAAALRGMAQRIDATSLLAEVTVPALVICGEEDLISTSREMRGIAAAMPNAEFVEIGGAGHMSPLENPDHVNAAIQSVLSDM